MSVEFRPFSPPPPPPGGCAIDLISWGVPFRLAADSPLLFDRVRSLAPIGSVPNPDPPASAHVYALRHSAAHRRFQVFCNDELLAEDISLDAALVQLGAHLTMYVAEYSPDYVFVHAGVVAWRDKALLLPGVSFAGKSTLVAELVRAGATYFSDEFAPIDSHGLVHPFPRDLRLRQPGGREQTSTPIEQMDGRAGTLPAPIAMAVFTQFDANGQWAPEQLSPGRAALEMLLHVVPVQRTPARVLSTLSAVLSHATTWRTSRGEASIAARRLLAALETGGLI